MLVLNENGMNKLLLSLIDQSSFPFVFFKIS